MDNTRGTSQAADGQIDSPGRHILFSRSGELRSSTQLPPGGSPAARRLLGLRTLKAEVTAKRTNEALAEIHQHTTSPTKHRARSPPLPEGEIYITRSVALKMQYQQSPLRRRDVTSLTKTEEVGAPTKRKQSPEEKGEQDDPTLSVPQVNAVVPKNQAQIAPEVTADLKKALLLVSCWDAVSSGKPVNIEELRTIGCLPPEKQTASPSAKTEVKHYSQHSKGHAADNGVFNKNECVRDKNNIINTNAPDSSYYKGSVEMPSSSASRPASPRRGPAATEVSRLLLARLKELAYARDESHLILPSSHFKKDSIGASNVGNTIMSAAQSSLTDDAAPLLSASLLYATKTQREEEVSKAVSIVLMSVGEIRRRVSMCVDRWEQLALRATDQTSNTSGLPIRDNENNGEQDESEVNHKNLGILSAREGRPIAITLPNATVLMPSDSPSATCTSLETHSHHHHHQAEEASSSLSRAACRAVGLLFPDATDARTLTEEVVGEVAADLKSFLAASAVLKHDICTTLIPTVDDVVAENTRLRMHLAAALCHLLKMQTVQNVLEMERVSAIDLVSSYENVTSRQHADLSLCCSLAIGAIDAGAGVLNKQAKASAAVAAAAAAASANTSTSSAGDGEIAPSLVAPSTATTATSISELTITSANISGLLQTFSEVRSRIAGTQNEATAAYEKEVKGALADRTRRSVIDSAALSEEVRRLHEMTGEVLYSPRGPTNRAGVSSTTPHVDLDTNGDDDDQAVSLLLLSDHNIRIAKKQNNDQNGAQSSPSSSVVLASPESVSLGAQRPPSGTSLKPMALVPHPGGEKAAAVVARDLSSAVTKLRPLSSTPSGASSPRAVTVLENINGPIVANAVVATLRSQLASAQSMLGDMTQQFHAAQREVAKTSRVAALERDESAAAIARLKASRNMLLSERSAFMDALLLSSQQTQANPKEDSFGVARQRRSTIQGLRDNSTASNAAPRKASNSNKDNMLALTTASRDGVGRSCAASSNGARGVLFFSSGYTTHQLRVVGAALEAVKRYGDTRHAMRLACYSLWRLFVVTRRSERLQREHDDLRYCVESSPYKGAIMESYAKQHSQLSKDFTHTNNASNTAITVTNPLLRVSLSSLARSPPPQKDEAHPATNKGWVVTTNNAIEESNEMSSKPPIAMVDWSRERELADLVARITSQQSLLMTLATDRDELYVQNTLLKRRLIALTGSGSGGGGSEVGGDYATDEGVHFDTRGDASGGSSLPVSANKSPRLGVVPKQINSSGGGRQGQVIASTANLLSASGAFPLVPPQQLQALIEENMHLLVNPNLRAEKKKSLMGSRGAIIPTAGLDGEVDADGEVAHSTSLPNSGTRGASDKDVRGNSNNDNDKDSYDAEEGEGERTGMGGRKAVRQVIIRNPLGAGPAAAKAITDATRTLRRMDRASVGGDADTVHPAAVGYEHSKPTALDPLVAGESHTLEGQHRNKNTNTNKCGPSVNTYPMDGKGAAVPAMPGTEGSPKQAQRAFAVNNDYNNANNNNDDNSFYHGDAVGGEGTEMSDHKHRPSSRGGGVRRGGSPQGGGGVTSLDANLSSLSEENFAHALAEKLMPIATQLRLSQNTATSNKRGGGGAKAGSRRKKSPTDGAHAEGARSSTDAVRSRMRQIKNISKEEAALQRVADEVERNLAATSTVGAAGVGSKGAVTLDTVQMNALRVYAILHPILQGILRRLKVVSLRIEPLPLYEATTQPIIAIVMGWVERNFSRLLHVLTCEDRVLRVKWRMAFLGIKLRSRIAATESDIQHGRTDQQTRALIKLQLSEYWLILKGATSCRQHAEAIRKTLRTAHMGSTPEKQNQLQREMLATVTALEDEAEGYVRRTLNNTFRARRQQHNGADAALSLTGSAGGGEESLDNGSPTALLQFALEARAHEWNKERLREAVDTEATRRNARSVWAGVVLARPTAKGTPSSGSMDHAMVRGGNISVGPTIADSAVGAVGVEGAHGGVIGGGGGGVLTPLRVTSPSMNRSGTHLAGASRVNRILEGVARDQQRLQKKAHTALLVSASKRKEQQQRHESANINANSPPDANPSTPSRPSITSTTTASGIHETISDNVEVLSELRRVHAAITNAERTIASRGVSRGQPLPFVTASAASSSSGGLHMYGCDLGPVIGPQSSKVILKPSDVSRTSGSSRSGCGLYSFGRVTTPSSSSLTPSSRVGARHKTSGQLTPLPRPTTTMLFRTDDNHASTDPRYVSRIVKQYDDHVLSNVVPDRIEKNSEKEASSPFEVFNSECGRVITTDTLALPTETPLEATNRRLMLPN